jgi:undecaprenyl-diphosphatase
MFASLSRAADHGVLWLIVGGALSTSGRRRRRAAACGVAALGVTSALVNGPLKLITGRDRPNRAADEERRRLVRTPRTSSFPSGHSASAFAFAAGAGLEAPELVVPLGLLAAGVAYSRVYVRVHHRGDVLAGAAIGIAVAATMRVVAVRTRRAGGAAIPSRAATVAPIQTQAVLVTSPNAGRGDKLTAARVGLARAGIAIVAELRVDELSRFDDVIRTLMPARPLVIAAGGDGTVGSVADKLANRDLVLGVLPLGTSNDFARSLRIPIDLERAAELLQSGKVSSVDLGRVTPAGGRPVHFVHAATVGLNVSFAKLATRASLRRRLGRLTYIVAAVRALEHLEPFNCELRVDGRLERVTLTQLSVINAPVFGGVLGMRVVGSRADDHLLDVLAVERVPAHRLLLAGLYAVGKIKRRIAGVRPYHVRELGVHSDTPLELSLDGEVSGTLPADFVVVSEALRVVTPIDFERVDDHRRCRGCVPALSPERHRSPRL